MTKAIYKPVSADGGDEAGGFIFTIDDDDDNDNDDTNEMGYQDDADDADDADAAATRIEPLEIASFQSSSLSGFDDDLFSQGDNGELFNWKDPWLPSVTVTVVLILPCTLLSAHTFANLLGVWFIATPWCLHLVVSLATARHHHVTAVGSGGGSRRRVYTTLASALDIALLGLAYPSVARMLIRSNLFTELDGTICTEWSALVQQLRIQQGLAYAAASLRLAIGTNAICLRLATASMDSSMITTGTPTWLDRFYNTSFCCCGGCPYTFRTLGAPFLYLDSRVLRRFVVLISPQALQTRLQLRTSLRRTLTVLLLLATVLTAACLTSGALHLVPWSSPPPPPDHTAATTTADDDDLAYSCDPLDTTECWLPFPSFHSLVEDNTTVTKWRVNLQAKLLPQIKSRVPVQPEFLNRLDGFSTMAPMLFYLNGLKEAHEAGLDQLKHSIAESVSPNSVIYLVNIETHSLVHHTAEIDYLDGKRPLVMVFPAQPLQHNCHYAVAVVRAKDKLGRYIEPTAGLQNLLYNNNNNNNREFMKRKRRFQSVLIPALQAAAPWLESSLLSFGAEQGDAAPLQLLFDFHTISAESQLGPVRAVRDATVKQITAVNWHWKHDAHVRTIRQIDYECRNSNDGRSGSSSSSSNNLARTVHAELDVPWFLNKRGPGARSAVLDPASLLLDPSQRHLEPVKFVVHIPCSLKAAALGDTASGKPLRAVMEFGHGLFGNREEAQDSYLTRMANEQGYVITAMDWRGMSSYDLLVVAKVLISTPRLFEAVRDNLIQGYASKYALQHFSRHALLSMDWLTFEDDTAASGEDSESSAAVPTKSVPTFNNKLPSHVFYGISQGGILGAGYSALSGSTGLIDRAILGSPGTPFALIMTRSLDFAVYDKLLLLDFYNNRNVRMLLTLVQMAWDSVEASGVLATPVTEPFPPVLIQAGLGDVIVPAIASEALARAFNASTLPDSPRTVFGLETAPTANSKTSLGPHAAMTELMYDSEFLGLSADNVVPDKNWIHWCLRVDQAIISQTVEFINTGRVIDPCATDDNRCHRSNSNC